MRDVKDPEMRRAEIMEAALSLFIDSTLVSPEDVTKEMTTLQKTVDLEQNRYILLFGALIPYSAYWRFFRKGKKK